MGAALYGEPLKLIQRLLSVRRFISKTPDSRDEVSRIILNALALKGPMNISQLTREVGRERGSASRVTVRNRVRRLVEEGAIEKGARARMWLTLSRTLIAFDHHCFNNEVKGWKDEEDMLLPTLRKSRR